MVQKTENEDLAFDWIQLRKDMETGAHDETQKQKLMRKIYENPFVPIGTLATTFALGFGLYSFKAGRKKMSQYMMRTRILAQGFTVFAMILGVGISAKKKAEQRVNADPKKV